MSGFDGATYRKSQKAIQLNQMDLGIFVSQKLHTVNTVDLFKQYANADARPVGKQITGKLL